MKDNLCGLVLAGGKSQRMGKDKSKIMYHGKPETERLVQMLEKTCGRVFVSARPEQLEDAHINQFDVILDQPDYSGIGPIGGIISAFLKYPQCDWLVVACDLPFLTEDVIELLVSRHTPQQGLTAFYNAAGQLPEPLCAIYGADIFSALASFVNLGGRCPRKFIMEQQAMLLTLPHPGALDNINTHEEAERAKASFHEKHTR